MRLADADEMVARRCQRTLKRAVERGQDFVPTIIVIRAGQEIAIVDPPSTEQMLKAVEVAAAGLSADVVALVNDSYKAVDMTNPATGKQWQQGELEDTARNHRGIERGLVLECLTVVVANRAGDVRVHSMPYERRGRSVRWLEEGAYEAKDGIENSGRIPDALRAIMAAPDLGMEVEEMVRADVEAGRLDPGGRPEPVKFRALLDAGSAEALAEIGCLVAMQVEPGSELYRALARAASKTHGKVRIEKPWSDNSMAHTDSDRLAISTGFAPVLKAAGYRLGNAEPFGPAGFIVRVVSGERRGAVIVTQQITDGIEMLHASISFNKDVMPTYTDLALLHRAVFGRKRYAYQVFVPTTEHVSYHDTALHLWGRVDGKPMLPLFAQDGMI